MSMCAWHGVQKSPNALMYRLTMESMKPVVKNAFNIVQLLLRTIMKNQGSVLKPNNVFLLTCPAEVKSNVPKMLPHIAPQTTNVKVALYHVEEIVTEDGGIAQDIVWMTSLGMEEVVVLKMIDLVVNNAPKESTFV